MATRYLARSLLTKHSLASVFSRSYATASAASVPNTASLLVRLRPLVAAASASYCRHLAPAISTRAFSTRQTNSSLSDPNPNWSNRPPKETILLDGCDFEHWLVVVDKPEGDPTRDEIISSYIQTLAKVVGSEEEARMKIYSVSTRHYFAFGALVSEELSYKLKEIPGVKWVLPDSYLDVKNKDYGGEPFINGQAVPYDPKYHEEWVRNNARANERNRRNDRPRNFDRSRNFDRRREMQGPNAGPSGPGGNFAGQPNAPPPPQQPNMGGVPQNNPGNFQPRGPPPNRQFGPGPNSGGAPYQSGPPPNSGGAPYQSGPPPNSGGVPYQSGPGPNQGGFPTGPGQGQYANAPPYPNQQNYPGRDSPSPPNNFDQNRGAYGPGQGGFDPNMGYGNQDNFAPKAGPIEGQYQNAYGHPQQNQNIQGRDFPQNPPNF